MKLDIDTIEIFLVKEAKTNLGRECLQMDDAYLFYKANQSKNFYQASEGLWLRINVNRDDNVILARTWVGCRRDKYSRALRFEEEFKAKDRLDGLLYQMSAKDVKNISSMVIIDPDSFDKYIKETYPIQDTLPEELRLAYIFASNPLLTT